MWCFVVICLNSLSDVMLAKIIMECKAILRRRKNEDL